jgi:NAD(P)-dependent dehydrogenase (short-subunit alcohol dehydrogenase family)
MPSSMLNYLPPKDLLSGRTILITGAGAGIGREVARAYAAHGATVILLGRTQQKLESLYDELIGVGAPEPVIHPLDLATAGAEDYQMLGASVQEQFGVLDGLVHNAAILGPRTPLQFYPPDIWNKVMQVNVTASFLLTRALLPALQSSQQARILFTASSVGRRGRAYWGGYAVSKFAIEGMMQVLAEELGETSNIRVNSINPGATRTAMRREAYPAEDPAQVPEAASLVPAYLYLMGPDSSDVHGQALNLRD